MGTKLAVVYIDLNDFKPVNDQLGHAAGDSILKTVGERIGPVLRDYDTLARLGGDEFAILVDNVRERRDCDILLARVIPVLNATISIGDNIVQISGSVGVALCPDDANTLDSVIAAADSAMYVAKQDKSRPYVYYSSKMDAAT